MTEIGSEFWQAETCRPRPVEGQTYLSGRAALGAVIADMAQLGIRSVSLPDYCCESMIEPFLRFGLRVAFYPVTSDDGELKLELSPAADCDAVFLVDYFGFMTEKMDQYVAQCHARGQKVLLDRTHAMFSPWAREADYVFGSVRKWTGVDAGLGARADGALLPWWPLTEQGREYLTLRSGARRIKKAFAKGGYTDEAARERQLSAFARAEELLDRDYLSDTDGENRRLLESLDGDLICSRRAANARIIYDYFPRLELCKPLFRELPAAGVPMFVPVLVPEELRASLRAALREVGIFCPVHWPHSSLHPAGASMLYGRELSLICDQRYEEADMIRMMETILLWQKTRSK